MPIVADNGGGSALSPTATGSVAVTPTAKASSDPMNATYLFIGGWVILTLFLVFFNQTRLGHVALYYSLLLMILLVLVTEYQQLYPFLTSITTPANLA